MKAVGSVVLIAGSLYVAYVGDKSRPTAPWKIPHIAGTWNATIVDIENEARCVGIVEISQPDGRGKITGSIESGCLSALFEAELLDGARWGILGKAHYEGRSQDADAPSDEYTASLFGHLEGSPDSRIVASTSAFTTSSGDPSRGGVRLELTRIAL